MAGPSNAISFLDPTSQIAQQQAAQQQALADELRSQSMQSIQQRSVGGIAGQESPMEGVAKLAQAWAANRVQRHANETRYDVAVNGANITRSMFGLPAYAGQNPYAGDPSVPRTGMQQIGDFLRGGPPVNMGHAVNLASQAPSASAPQPPLGQDAPATASPVDASSASPPQASPDALAAGLARAQPQPSAPPQVVAPSQATPSPDTPPQGGQPPQAPPQASPTALAAGLARS